MLRQGRGEELENTHEVGVGANYWAGRDTLVVVDRLKKNKFMKSFVRILSNVKFSTYCQQK